MSAERRPDPASLASDHLDGLLVGAAWREVRAEHGEDLERALQEEHRRRAAIASLPPASLDAPRRAAIMDAVRATRVGAAAAQSEAAADDTPPPDAATPDADGEDRPPLQGPRWWWAAVPALLAAVLVVAVWPLLTDPDPHAPQTDAPTGAASAPDLARSGPAEDHDAAEEAAPAPAVEVANATGPADERGSAADEAVAARAPRATTGADRTAGTAARPSSGAGATASGRAGSSAPGVAAKAEIAEGSPLADGAVAEDDAAFGDLLAEAEAFERQRAQTGTAAEPAAPSAEVTRDALAAEVRRRGDAAAGDTGLVIALDPEPELRLGITMGLIPADTADGVPELEILLINRSERELDRLGDLLELQGLDAEGRVVWRAPAPAPEGAVIEPGAGLRWRLPLDAGRLPPPEVKALRLASGDLVGETLPLE